MNPNSKALKEARSYIVPALQYCLFDCSDSMHESDKIEARFEAVTDDKVHIGDFIAEHLFDDYIKVLKPLLVEYGTGDTVETFSCGVCEPPVPLEVVKKRLNATKSAEKPSANMSTVKVYGASDDLIEVDGDIREEFSPNIDNPYHLLFSNGTQVKVEWCPDPSDTPASWAVTIVDVGLNKVRRLKGIDDSGSDADESKGHQDTDASVYSDVVIIESDEPLTLVKHGSRKLKMPSPKQAVSLSRAEAVIEYLEGKGGFDHWWDDIDSDIKNEIVEGLARLLDGRSIENKTFVITGTLSAPRKEMAERIEEAGGIVSSLISAKTDYLVVGEDAGSKVEKAQELGVKMVSESELEEMLG